MFSSVNTKIEDIMNKGVFTISVSDTIKKADELMRDEKIKHLPVVEGTKYVGIITDRSIIEYSLRQLYDFEDNLGEGSHNLITDFQRIITKQDNVIYPEDSVKKAIKMMAKYKLECLPVVDWKMNLLGIITTSDIMLFIHKLMEEYEEK